VTQTEKEKALQYLEMTKKNVLEATKGLSEAQWNFKPAPDRWSIAEIAEHLILSEDLLFKEEREMLKSAAVAERAHDIGKDAQILKREVDRSVKATAPADLTPSGRYKTPAEAAQAFKERRDRIIKYVETTPDDLRSHVSGEGADATDAYDSLIVIAGHTERHVAQIDDVKVEAGYPRR
jgi:hypothetical protein